MLLFVPLQYLSYKRQILFKALLEYIQNKSTEICVIFWIEWAQTKQVDLYCYYWKQYLAQPLWTALTLSMRAVSMSLPMATASVDKLKSGKLNDQEKNSTQIKMFHFPALFHSYIFQQGKISLQRFRMNTIFMDTIDHKQIPEMRQHIGGQIPCNKPFHMPRM